MPAILQRLGRDRIVLLVVLLFVAAIGWLMLVGMNAEMNSAMKNTHMTAADDVGLSGMLMSHLVHAPPPATGSTLAMWLVMMLAMMAPAASPGVCAYLALARRRHPQRSAVPAALGFSAGYLGAWFGYGALAALAQSVLAQALLLSSMGTLAGSYLGSSVLMVVGAYQLTPLKRVCVAHCRNPVLHLMTDWHDGLGGALRLGLRHGGWCVGCCWALMTLAFVVGVMNVAWMMVLAAFFLAEKLVPARWHMDTVAGLLLLGGGAWLSAAPLLSTCGC